MTKVGNERSRQSPVDHCEIGSSAAMYRVTVSVCQNGITVKELK